MKKSCLCYLILLVLIVSISVQAMPYERPYNTSNLFHNPDILYVDDDNTNGPWYGTLEYPYQTITDATIAAVDSDTIYVFSGSYTENLTLTKKLQLIGENQTTTILNGNYSSNIVTIDHTFIVIKNFTIKNTGGNPNNAGIHIKKPNVDIQNCLIYRSETGIFLNQTENVTITKTKLMATGDGIFLKNSSMITISDCYIAQNGLGIHCNQSTDIQIDSCFIHLNGIGIFISESNQITIRKSAISNNCDNQGGIFIDDSTTITVDNCNIIHNGFGFKIERSEALIIKNSTMQYNTHFAAVIRYDCDNIMITKNDISLNYRYGLHIQESTISANQNNFYYNHIYGIHAERSTCNAKYNWWNSARGPAITGLTSADRISFNPRHITFFPWTIKSIQPCGTNWKTEDYFVEYPLPYDTDSIISLLGNDSDSDTVPDWWETKWGYNPQSWDNHTHLDPDQDGLNNIEECYTDIYGSNPYHKDIFLEIDWTTSNNPNATNRPSQERTNEMIQRFADHNITLHVDLGSYQGGEEIPPQQEFNYDVLRKLYWKYFLDNDMNNPRKNIFHWGIITDFGPGPGFSFIGWYHHDAFCISAQKLDQGNPLYSRDTLILTGSMHELGHTLGLFADDHGGNDNRAAVKPWYKDFWQYRNYKSCMNYRYTWDILDYSDGTHGYGDFNDWETLDFMFFKNTRYDIPKR